MNWTKAVIAGVVGGIVVSIYNFLVHGFIMGETYTRYEVFSQEAANPLFFFLVAICVGIAAALLFGKTRACWADGISGGATFGFFLGLVFFFLPFYSPLVLKDFPYYLSWCWGGIDLIGSVLLGVILGLLYKA